MQTIAFNTIAALSITTFLTIRRVHFINQFKKGILKTTSFTIRLLQY